MPRRATTTPLPMLTAPAAAAAPRLSTHPALPRHPHSFVWSEVYLNDDALVKHLSNPAVGDYIGKHADLAAAFNGRNDGPALSVEIYGSPGAEAKAAADALGIQVKYFDTVLGYSRVGRLVRGQREKGDPAP